MILQSNTPFYQRVAIVMVFLLSFQAAFPTVSWALTSGPAQPEFTSFEPVGTTQMVDLFSGDFVYNIPLFELPGPNGGYPFNLAYHSGVSMDQEASWVGLGWTLNSGAINRIMRGLPDDFNGVDVKRKTDMKPNETWTFGGNVHTEFWGYEKGAQKIEGNNSTSFSVKLGLNAIHNNYRGWSAGSTLGLSGGNNKQDGYGFTGGLTMGIHSLEGASLQPSISLSHAEEGQRKRLSLSTGINSREGLTSISLGYNYTASRSENDDNGEKASRRSNRGDLGVNYSFGKVAYSPQVSVAYQGFNFTRSIEAGMWTSIFSFGGKINVGYNRQALFQPKVWTSAKAYGFFHLDSRNETGIEADALMDFNREKDGPIRSFTPNLATPITTPDIYNVVGQGIGGSYQAYRSDVGILTDPQRGSLYGGTVAGVELGFGNGFDLGADVGGNWATSRSSKWETNFDNLIGYYDSLHLNTTYESFYFKAAGELTADLDQAYAKHGGDRALSMKLHDIGDDNSTGGTRMDMDADPHFQYTDRSDFDLAPEMKRTTRKARGNTLQSITNGDLMDGNKLAMKEYDINYFTRDRLSPAGSEEAYLAQNNNSDDILRARQGQVIRSTNANEIDQVAALTALHPDGLRYVYGLPVKNLEQQEYMYSIAESSNAGCSRTRSILANGPDEIDYQNGNDQYLNVTDMPTYTHAHLLTAVLGADYVDLDDIPGPSDGDYGYWVKFNYVQANDDGIPYQWKTPYAGANFLEGVRNDSGDDKSSFLYGKREQYYLATAETRSHLAVFDLQKRADARGVKTKFQNVTANTTAALGEPTYLLDKIRLFSKLEITKLNIKPIKTVHFEYDYSQCTGVPNNDNTYRHLNQNGAPISVNEGGKLTLKKMWFTYEDSGRGKLSPYKFMYSDNNPAYDESQYDRWGCFQDITEGITGTDACYAVDHPYVFQGRRNQGSNPPKLADYNASAWHIDEIQLPSGASIQIDYESDDYAYVQDRTAMEMFPIAGFKTVNTNTGSEDELYTGVIPNNPSSGDLENLKVYFELGDDYEPGTFEAYIQDIHLVPIIDVLLNNDPVHEYQIYYKVLMELNDNNEKEYVSGYANVYTDPTTGLPEGGVETVNNVDYGWLRLRPIELGKKGVGTLKNYHPFCGAAWQKLKLEHPDKIRDDNLDSYDHKSFRQALGAMGRALTEVRGFFKNFYSKCSDSEFGKRVDLANSFIRLNTPDKEKEGGGSRVRQITLLDNWDVGEDNNQDNDVPTYGQVYEYTTLENDQLISSGVAINEPSIGGDESALRYAKQWTQSRATKTNEHLFFEYPINEAYYPGASVGYSEVKVSSLATHIAKYGTGNPNDQLPTGFGTTGITINKFYTAKDFPVLVEETGLDKRIGNPRWVPYLVGSATNEKYTGSQGYAIILNDMHGKSKQVGQYAERIAADGSIALDTINKVTYTYAINDSKVYTSAGKKSVTKVLNNKVNVLLGDDPQQADASIVEAEMGIDHEFFVDLRESISNSGSMFGGVNADFANPIAFGVGVWPKLNLNYSKTRLAVTNKIIRKSGILLETDVYDGQSHIVTTNKVFDPLTGEPLLTTVNNSFDNPVFNYQVPARYAYEGMGGAYENLGMTFDGNLSLDENCGRFNMINLSSAVSNALYPGDECIITDGCGNVSGLCDAKRFTYVGKFDGKHLFENTDLDLDPEGSGITMMVVRSGKRNHLSAKVGSITALSDPTKNRTRNVYSPNLSVPTSASNTTTHPSSVAVRQVDDVLSINALTYSDDWEMDRGACSDRVITKTIEISPPTTEVQNCLIVEFGLGSDSGCGVGVDWYIDYFVDGVPMRRQETSVTTLRDTIVCSGASVSIDDYAITLFPGNGCQFPSMEANVETVVVNHPGEYSVVNTTIPAENYSLGQKGVWRPHQNYVYVDKRTPNETGFPTSQIVDYDLETAGVIDAVPLFNWQTPFFLEAVQNEPNVGKWKKTNEISKYGFNGEEIENRDIIGLYSTALYGYNYNVPIGVASNASHFEVAFEGFEEYPINGGLANSTLSDGHLNFHCANQASITSQTYNIVNAYRGDFYLWIDKPYYENAPLPYKVELRLISEHGERYTVTGDATTFDPVTDAGIPFYGDITGLQLGGNLDLCGLPSNASYTGTVQLKYCYSCDTNNSPFPSGVIVNNNVAHTGKNSLRIDAIGISEFPQKELQLVKNKSYLFSAWVSRFGVQQQSYDDGSIKLGVRSGTTSSVFPPQGPIIEGWQRVEGVFTYTGDDQDLALVVEYDNTSGDVEGNPYYIDDLRIYPLDGSFQTYVYDPQDYRLQAVLDENNYATFYQYDEEGNLVVVKKETAKGIKTIQENRSFIKPVN